MSMETRAKKICDASGVTRRQALAIGAGGLAFGLAGGVVPMPPVFGAMSQAVAATPGKIVIVYEWFGGFDGLSTFVPYGNDELYRHRPNLGVRADTVIKVDEHHGFQKSMGRMHNMWEEGKVAVIHGVGYDQPSFSHFSSSSYWHTGAPNSGEEYGWFGRVADALDPTGTPNFLVNKGSQQSLAVRAHFHQPVVFDDPTTFHREVFNQQLKVARELVDAKQPPVNDVHKYMLDVNQSAAQASALVGAAWDNYTPNNDLRLRELTEIVALIEADFPARLYYVPLQGSIFDTHVRQTSPHNRQVQYCSDAVWGFYKEMERIGRADDVVMFIHSEFGRRVYENTGGGTDHGTANVAFVIGGGVKGGQYGTPVSLTDLVLDGNLQHTMDFRRVYATLIEEALGYPESEAVLGSQFKTLGMFG